MCASAEVLGQSRGFNWVFVEALLEDEMIFNSYAEVAMM